MSKLRPGKRQQRDATILTPREGLFVLKMITLENVVEAYLQAGYHCTRESASASGGDLLGKPRVARALAEARAKRLGLAEMDADDAMRRIGVIARFDPRKLFDRAGRMLAIQDWPDDAALAVKTIDDNTSGRRVSFEARLPALLAIAEAGGRIRKKLDIGMSFDHLGYLERLDKGEK
jgi:phage terminase small subunit